MISTKELNKVLRYHETSPDCLEAFQNSTEASWLGYDEKRDAFYYFAAGWKAALKQRELQDRERK